jgi:hypothetical protein
MAVTDDAAIADWDAAVMAGRVEARYGNQPRNSVRQAGHDEA